MTWLVIGPVSMVLITLKGGCALKTCVAPMSFSVNQTCLPSGLAAIFGQKGLAWSRWPMIRWSATEITTVSGVKEEQT